jgi:hypothetical protein
MTIAHFLARPWTNPHPAYADSMVALQPAPEFATSEVLVASLYRAVGYPDVAEREVPQLGRQLDRAARRAQLKTAHPAGASPEAWRAVLHGVIESPKQPNQSAKRFLQLTPVVPEAALYSGSARLAGNPWNPGELAKRIVWAGAPSEAAAEAIWMGLHQALSVGEDDDAWARWLHQEFARQAVSEHAWCPPGPLGLKGLAEDERAHLSMPAQQVVRDLKAVIAAKRAMTRRQWVSVLEAVLRLGAAAHVLWVCRSNQRLWRLVDEALSEGAPPLPADVAAMRRAVLDQAQAMFAYGRAAGATIKDVASQYLAARLGINLALWMLEEQAGVTHRADLTSSRGMLEVLQQLRQHAPAMRANGFQGRLAALRDEHARTINCKSGIGKNIVEFTRHVLGQRQTAKPALRGYDQGYALRRRGEAATSPFVVSFGPVAVLALVHCCLAGVRGPRSVRRLSLHLARYGIALGVDDVATSDLGQKLRMLGLVLDSPDAESGMLLVPPFDHATQLEALA